METESEFTNDASAYALQSLLGSTQLRNAKAVKDLQKALGPLQILLGAKMRNNGISSMLLDIMVAVGIPLLGMG